MIVAADLEKILEKEQNNILLVLDGYDEQLKHCEDKTMMADVIEIIQGEHDRNFNLIVTTRPWKSELLRGYDTMKIKSKWNKATRNQYIENFFFNFDTSHCTSEEMIRVLDDKKHNIIPKELQMNFRMLQYLCHVCEIDGSSVLFDKEKLLAQNLGDFVSSNKV